MFAENDEDDVDQSQGSSFLKVYKEGEEEEDLENEKKLTKDQVKFTDDNADEEDNDDEEPKDKSLLIAEIGSKTFDQKERK